MQVEREIVVPEPPEEVWAALTEPERLEEWFATEAELDAAPGGEGVFRWGDGEERRGVVREAEEAERLVLDWDDGGEVAISLEETEDGTCVRVVETSPEFSTALGLWLEVLSAEPPAPGEQTVPSATALRALAWTAVA